jgi:hypothetical protein
MIAANSAIFAEALSDEYYNRVSSWDSENGNRETYVQGSRLLSSLLVIITKKLFL